MLSILYYYMKGSIMKWKNEKEDLPKEQTHPHETKGMHQRLKENWRNAMASIHRKMSRGAEYLVKIKTWGHAEGWRRNHGHSNDKKKQ